MLSKWGQRFSPLSLFAAGEQGGWWDPSDFSTMFQDSAGTTPVTAVGQPVGLIRDKSGRGNHASQGTTASRPTLQQDATGFYLLFDGVDDSLATASVDFSATDKMTVFAGVTKNNDTTAHVVLELGPVVDTNVGTFGVFASGATGDASRRTWGVTLNAGTAVGAGAAIFAATDSRALTAMLDIAGSTNATEQQMRLNGAAQTLSYNLGGPSGTGNFIAGALNIGRRADGTIPLPGRIYNLIVRGALSTAAQIAQAERYVGSKMGIAL